MSDFSFYSLKSGPLLEEAMPSLSASGFIFANAPEGTREIWLTLRTAGITLRTDGGIPSAGVNGSDFAADAATPYVFRATQSQALLMTAIQNGGTATGWISYRG